MTRKTDAGILVAIFIAGIFAIEAQTPFIHGQGVTFVVDDDGLDTFCLDQYNGGEAPDFNTINDAIGAAASGDTIIVCPGTYAEHVVITAGKTDLTLLGFGCSRTIIDPPGASNAISILADGTTIDGFEITGGINGIESSSGDEIDFTMIKHNCIHDNTADGIHFDEGSENIIRNNDIFSNGDEGVFFGVLGSTSDMNWIGNNEVHDNGTNGIAMQDDSSTGNEINGNKVRDNGIGFWGIDVDSDILVKSNKVISNDGGILARGDGNTFLRNTSNENAKEGFRTIDIMSSLNIFDKNTAKGNGEQGFSDKGTMNTFTGNTAKMNTLQGFLITGTDGVFTDNAARKNTLQGLLITGDDGVFDGNRARNNGDDGFEVDAASSGNSFESNKSNLNGAFGFLDASVGGTGDFGTDNFYDSNTCNGNTSGDSSPADLCT
ncbi:MAG: right-handed parallel beta-helix repeat-containing protein [Nitrososphaerales archaeon]